MSPSDAPSPVPSDKSATTLRRALRSGALEVIQGGLEPMERAWDALTRQDWPEIARQMHSLRGSAGSFDPGPFVAATRAVEDAIRSRRFEEIPALLGEAQGHYQTVLDLIARWVEEAPLDDESAPSEATAPLDASALVHLVYLLETQSFDAIDTFARLRPALAERHATVAADVERQLDRLDFQAGAAQLRALVAALGTAADGA